MIRRSVVSEIYDAPSDVERKSSFERGERLHRPHSFGPERRCKSIIYMSLYEHIVADLYFVLWAQYSRRRRNK